MKTLPHLFDNNRTWAEAIKAEDPAFFQKLANQQSPEYLWHRWDRLCELIVIEQAANVCQTTIVRDAWARGQELSVHGWIYAVGDGLLRDLKMCVSGQDEVSPLYAAALKQPRTTEGQQS